MEAKCSSETSLGFQRIARHIPMEWTLHNHRCENFRSSRRHYLSSHHYAETFEYHTAFLHCKLWPRFAQRTGEGTWNNTNLNNRRFSCENTKTHHWTGSWKQFSGPFSQPTPKIFLDVSLSPLGRCFPKAFEENTELTALYIWHGNIHLNPYLVTIHKHRLIRKSTVFCDIKPFSPLKVTDVSEEHMTSIFRVKPRKIPAWKQVADRVSCSDFSTQKMDAICSSETSVDFQRRTRRYIAEDSIVHNHRCESIKSYILWFNSAPCVLYSWNIVVEQRRNQSVTGIENCTRVRNVTP
jgi:hypothetical protein